jgi:hypothetical protein
MILHGALEIQMDRIAGDLGRLHKHLAGMVEDYPGTHTAYLVERISNAVESIDAMVNPTAAELVEEGLSVEEAFAEVNRQRAALLRTLGREQRAEDFDPGVPPSIFLSQRLRKRAP